MGWFGRHMAGQPILLRMSIISCWDESKITVWTMCHCWVGDLAKRHSINNSKWGFFSLKSHFRYACQNISLYLGHLVKCEFWNFDKSHYVMTNDAKVCNYLCTYFRLLVHMFLIEWGFINSSKVRINSHWRPPSNNLMK